MHVNNTQIYNNYIEDVKTIINVNFSSFVRNKRYEQYPHKIPVYTEFNYNFYKFKLKITNEYEFYKYIIIVIHRSISTRKFPFYALCVRIYRIYPYGNDNTIDKSE